MLREFRLLLKKVGKDGLEALETPEPVAAAEDDLPLFGESGA